MKQWTERDCTSQVGIAKLFRIVTDMGYIWRPTPNSDVGLDGEIELVIAPVQREKVPCALLAGEDAAKEELRGT